MIKKKKKPSYTKIAKEKDMMKDIDGYLKRIYHVTITLKLNSYKILISLLI